MAGEWRKTALPHGPGQMTPEIASDAGWGRLLTLMMFGHDDGKNVALGQRLLRRDQHLHVVALLCMLVVTSSYLIAGW